jgi:hypothetical protein
VPLSRLTGNASAADTGPMPATIEAQRARLRERTVRLTAKPLTVHVRP